MRRLFHLQCKITNIYLYKAHMYNGSPSTLSCGSRKMEMYMEAVLSSQLSKAREPQSYKQTPSFKMCRTGRKQEA